MQASAFVMFPDVHTACAAASVLRDETSVDAVELFDRAALRSEFTTLVHFDPPIPDRGGHVFYFIFSNQPGLNNLNQDGRQHC